MPFLFVPRQGRNPFLFLGLWWKGGGGSACVWWQKDVGGGSWYSNTGHVIPLCVHYSLENTREPSPCWLYGSCYTLLCFTGILSGTRLFWYYWFRRQNHPLFKSQEPFSGKKISNTIPPVFIPFLCTSVSLSWPLVRGKSLSAYLCLLCFGVQFDAALSLEWREDRVPMGNPSAVEERGVITLRQWLPKARLLAAQLKISSCLITSRIQTGLSGITPIIRTPFSFFQELLFRSWPERWLCVQALTSLIFNPFSKPRF